MNRDSQPTNRELLEAIFALRAFTETGLQRLDAKVDLLRLDMNRRFDRVHQDLDELKVRVTRLEAGRA